MESAEACFVRVLEAPHLDLQGTRKLMRATFVRHLDEAAKAEIEMLAECWPLPQV